MWFSESPEGKARDVGAVDIVALAEERDGPATRLVSGETNEDLGCAIVSTLGIVGRRSRSKVQDGPGQVASGASTNTPETGVRRGLAGGGAEAKGDAAGVRRALLRVGGVSSRGAGARRRRRRE